MGTLLTAGKPVSRLELAAGRLYAAAGRRVFVWALPCCAPLASVEVSKECGAICSLAVGPRVRGIGPGVSMRKSCEAMQLLLTKEHCATSAPLLSGPR